MLTLSMLTFAFLCHRSRCVGRLDLVVIYNERTGRDERWGMVGRLDWGKGDMMCSICCLSQSDGLINIAAECRVITAETWTCEDNDRVKLVAKRIVLCIFATYGLI